MSKSKFIKKDKIKIDIIPEIARTKFEDINVGDSFTDDLHKSQYTKLDHIHAVDNEGNKVIFYPEDVVIIKNPQGDNNV